MRVLLSQSQVTIGQKPEEWYINYEEDGRWFHARSTAVEAPALEELQGVEVFRRNFFPKYSNQLVFIPDKQAPNVYIKEMEKSDIGYLSGTKKSFFGEIEVYEKLLEHPHPNICQYYGCIVDDGLIIGIALEVCEKTLHECSEWPALGGIQDAVRHIHSLGFVHGDLSPHNIMIKDGIPKLIDFDSSSKDSHKRGTEHWQSDNYTRSTDDDLYSLDRIMRHEH
ncbi:hypothetical protein GGF37_000977 [Kickxella alabastrina]|nr:hypothetical protein GGF37_000977 [Kickxella alabastrina]